MKANAKVKKVNVDGMVLSYYRFKISFENHKKEEKIFYRWASSAENAIKTLCQQYKWQFDDLLTMPESDDYCKARIKVYVPNSKQSGTLSISGGNNYFYNVESWQCDD